MFRDIPLFAAGIYFFFLIESDFITALSALIYFKCAKSMPRKIDVRDKKFDLKNNYIICILILFIGIAIGFYSLRAAAIYAGFNGMLIGILFIFVPKQFTRIRSVKNGEYKKCVRLVFSVKKLNILFSPCALKHYYTVTYAGAWLIAFCTAAAMILTR